MAFMRSVSLPVVIATIVLHAIAAKTDDAKSPAAPNPLALLRDLTPIAGTNLFLNIPYKMIDRTKPGCFATWFNEKYQDWKGTHKGVSMACNKHDQQWYNTLDASWVFERTDGSKISTGEYNGAVKIRNLGAGLSLETWLSAGNWWVGLGGYAGNPAEDMWNVRSDPNDKNNLQLEMQHWWLVQYPTVANHRANIALKKNDPSGYPYSFVPSVDLEARMYDFVFTRPMDSQIAQLSSKKDLVDSYDINNDSPATLSRTVSVSEKVTNEFAWGFSESLKNFAKVKGEVGVPFIAKSEVEAGFELTIAANQNWKNTKEKSFTMSYTVNVPPGSNVRVSAWYDLIKGISMDYTASTEITGNSTRITVFDDLVKESPATGEMIRKHLEYSKFDGKIVEIKDFSVIAQIKGTMVASVGVRGQLNVDGKTVVMQVVPK